MRKIIIRATTILTLNVDDSLRGEQLDDVVCDILEGSDDIGDGYDVECMDIMVDDWTEVSNTLIEKNKKMESKVITVLRHWDDHEAVVLGHVIRPPSMPENDVIDNISKLWDEFIETEPDCDTEFIGYLEEHNGYTEVESPELVVNVGSGFAPFVDK